MNRAYRRANGIDVTEKIKVMEITEEHRNLYMPHIADGELIVIDGVNDGKPMRVKVKSVAAEPQIGEKGKICLQ